MNWTDPDDFENPDRWTDDDLDLSELDPFDCPAWALDGLEGQDE